MKSLSLAEIPLELGVGKTHSRPRVSNDNPYSESQSKTPKNWPGFPERFASSTHALEICRAFFGWDNRQHHHSALCSLTPAVVHHGKADANDAGRSGGRPGYQHLRAAAPTGACDRDCAAAL